MIDKPIDLHIRLTYSQAIVLRNQLEYQLNKKKRKDKENETSIFRKWKEENK